MRFAPTDEQELLRTELRRFVANRAPLSATRRRLEAGEGHDPDAWLGLATEMALPSLWLPEALGGPGTGAVDVAVALEELGRELYPGPFLTSAVMATRALVHAGAEDRLAKLVDGTEIAALAHADAGGGWRPEAVETIAEGSGAERSVSGVKRRVPLAAAADRLLVVARSPGSAGADGIVLLALDADAAGVAVEPLEGLDPTRPTAAVRLDGARGAVVADDAEALVRRTIDEASMAAAAEIVGAAQRCLEMIVEYAGQRVQFGKPIGTFQSVKHRCADLLVALEHARSAAYVAACRADEGDAAALAAASALALATCGEAGAQTGRAAIQLHGGIGFTWEHDAHLYLRRLRASEHALGSPAWQRERLWSSSAERELVGSA